MAILTTTELKWLKDVLEDAEWCFSLGEKELRFLENLREDMPLRKNMMMLSEAQMAWLKRIELKVYAT